MQTLNHEEALALLRQYNSEPFHIQHGLATRTTPVSGRQSASSTTSTSSSTPTSTASKRPSCCAPQAAATT